MIIGLSGYAGSGKTTVAKETGCQIRRFATSLKRMLSTFLRLQGVNSFDVGRMIAGDLKDTPCDALNGKTPRYAMQTLGTEWGRALISEDIWSDAAMRAIDGICDDVVFDDVRFENEVEAIRSRGGIVVRIERPGVTRPSKHASEEPCSADYIVQNTGTPAEVAAEVLRLWKTQPVDEEVEVITHTNLDGTWVEFHIRKEGFSEPVEQRFYLGFDHNGWVVKKCVDGRFHNATLKGRINTIDKPIGVWTLTMDEDDTP